MERRDLHAMRIRRGVLILRQSNARTEEDLDKVRC